MIGQTLAMALDAYRELHARKLFWITLIISGFVVLAFGALGIDERGLKILWFSMENQFLNTQFVPAADFYRGLFMGLGLKFWLTWAAAILALISTAGIFPELITGGSIDLWLSRPISRWRLFLTKFFLGLTFVLLQVSVFTTASFFVLGFRAGIWEPGLFIAIPLVTIFFSYLFAICTLLGVVTRSTIAALLLTLLAWFGIFLVHSAESILYTGRVATELQIRSIESDIAEHHDAGTPVSASLEEELERAERHDRWWTGLHRGAFVLKTALPKTEETIELLNRSLVEMAKMPEPVDELDGMGAGAGPFGSSRVSQFEVARVVQERLHERPVWWVLGTSLLFVACTVGLAGAVFCRRDY